MKARTTRALEYNRNEPFKWSTTHQLGVLDPHDEKRILGVSFFHVNQERLVQAKFSRVAFRFGLYESARCNGGTLGIEMEAAAISEAAHRQRHRQLDWLVMKGVMDFADHGRDDHFKDYAARSEPAITRIFGPYMP